MSTWQTTYASERFHVVCEHVPNLISACPQNMQIKKHVDSQCLGGMSSLPASQCLPLVLQLLSLSTSQVLCKVCTHKGTPSRMFMFWTRAHETFLEISTYILIPRIILSDLFFYLHGLHHPLPHLPSFPCSPKNI